MFGACDQDPGQWEAVLPKKSVHQNVHPNCWDFFTEMGRRGLAGVDEGGGGGAHARCTQEGALACTGGPWGVGGWGSGLHWKGRGLRSLRRLVKWLAAVTVS